MDGYRKKIKKKMKTFLEAVIDIPRRTYAKGVFDEADTNNPKIKDSVKKENLKLINEGITIKKLRYNKINVIIEKITKHYTWLIVKLNEGKNREIRKIFEYFYTKLAIQK